MQFAGFTPQQQFQILQKLGYSGSPQEDEMDQALAANPNLAAGLGKMAEVAQRRIDMRLGKPSKGFAEGGMVSRDQFDPNAYLAANQDVANHPGYSAANAYDHYVKHGFQEGRQLSLPDPVAEQQAAAASGEGNIQGMTLQQAQQNYADAVQSGDADALQKATQELQRTQQAYQVTQVPTADQVLKEGILNPEAHTVKQQVAQIQPTNDQLIAAGTGRQVSSPQATGVEGMWQYQPPQAEATTADATTAQAAQRTDAQTYEATTVQDKVDTTLNDLEAATAQPTEAATVQGQMAKLMKDFDDGTPPWASGAMREATAIMQRRGLGASSMAGEAITLAAMQAALGIASQDAQTNAQFELQNLNNRQQTTIFKAQQRMAGLFTDQAAENAAKQFNAQSKQQTDQFFANLETQVSQFNAAQVNGIRMFNAEQENLTGRFNVEQQTTVDMFRAKEQNALDMFNTQIKQQRDQFNASNDLLIAQANTEWMRQISTTNTAAINLANRDAAAAANTLTQRQVDHLHQYERDIMAFAFQAGESAADRNVRLLLADKDLAVAREQMDREDEAAFGETLMRIFF